MPTPGLKICLRLCLILTFDLCIRVVLTQCTITIICACRVWLKSSDSSWNGFLWSILTSCDFDLWPPDPQSWPFHATAPDVSARRPCLPSGLGTCMEQLAVICQECKDISLFFFAHMFICCWLNFILHTLHILYYDVFASLWSVCLFWLKCEMAFVSVRHCYSVVGITMHEESWTKSTVRGLSTSLRKFRATLSKLTAIDSELTVEFVLCCCDWKPGLNCQLRVDRGCGLCMRVSFRVTFPGPHLHYIMTANPAAGDLLSTMGPYPW